MIFALPGWKFYREGNIMHVELENPPADNRNPSQQLTSFEDSFLIRDDWTDEQLINRVFVQLQYLLDHELREQFTVDGVRVFESHDPPVTGFQKEWFVEHASALRGY